MGNTPEKNDEVFDEDMALSGVGGDREYLAEVVGLVRAAWPTLLADMKQGLVVGDLRTVEARARLAKAAARYVAARRAYECAQQVETLTGKGDLQATQKAIASLEREAQLLQSALSMIGNSEGQA
jgi:hypothetical protein